MTERRRRWRAELRRQHHLHRRQPGRLGRADDVAVLRGQPRTRAAAPATSPRSASPRATATSTSAGTRRSRATRTMIASDGFSITVDADRDGTSGLTAAGSCSTPRALPTVQVERPFGTFTTVGAAQQSCNFVAVQQRRRGVDRGLVPAERLQRDGAHHRPPDRDARQREHELERQGLRARHRRRLCNGFFNLDTDTGTTTVDAGHATTTTLTCPETVRNLNQSTSTCTVTVHDTGFDTEQRVAVTVAHPTGTVNFSVSGGTGTFTPAVVHARRCGRSRRQHLHGDLHADRARHRHAHAQGDVRRRHGADPVRQQLRHRHGRDQLAANGHRAVAELRRREPACRPRRSALYHDRPRRGQHLHLHAGERHGQHRQRLVHDRRRPCEDGGEFDFETKSSYSIRVRTTDQGGLSFEKAFTITVTNVNEAPMITSNGGGATASINVAENTTAVTTVTAHRSRRGHDADVQHQRRRRCRPSSRSTRAPAC